MAQLQLSSWKAIIILNLYLWAQATSKQLTISIFAPQKMPENEKVKIHWDMKIQTDIKIMDYSRPDIVVEKECGYCNITL